jgi:hypothetical protein
MFSQTLLHSKALVVCVTLSFTIYTLTGCGSSRQAIAHLDKYDKEPYISAADFPAEQETIYRAVLNSVQSRGFLVTLSDPKTGLLTAEINQGKLLPEEEKQIEFDSQSKSSSSSVVWTILGVVFLVGIVIWILSLTSSNDETSSSKKEIEHSPPHHHHEEETIPTVKSFRYVVSFTITPIQTDTTTVRISAVRMNIENGTIVSTTTLENKFFNYSLFDRIDDNLKSLRR